MNNKHLLRVRLASIQHYNEELKRLADAKTATEETKSELIQSLLEFFPFSAGMIIMRIFGMNSMDVVKIESAPRIFENYNGDIIFRFEGTSLVYGTFRDCDRRDKDIALEDVNSWRILHEPQTPSHDTNE